MKTSRIPRFLLNVFSVLLCLGSIGQPYFAQNRSTISGMVFAPGRRPIAQIPVELLNETNSVIQRTRTDPSGRYLFSGVPSGRFAVRVLPLGTNLEEQEQEAQVAGISVDGRRRLSDNIQLDFLLSERKNRERQPNVGGVVFAQDIPETARKYYELAISNLKDKKGSSGEANLKNAIEVFPTYYAALLRLGLLGIELNRFEVAEDAFSRAVAVNDRSFTGWYGLSYSDFALNKTAAAISAAEKALEINRSSSDIFLLLGVMQRKVKDYAVAEKSLLQAKKLAAGKSPDIHWNLALLYAHNLKNYAAAAAELEAYLKLVPNVPNKNNVEKLIKQFRQRAADAHI